MVKLVHYALAVLVRSQKCGNCQGHVHLRCSGLPDYQLVRLSVTQSSFSCSNCVKSKDLKGDNAKYDAELNKLKELIAKEESLINQISEQSTISPPENSANANTSEEVRTQETATTKPVCKYYMQRSCRFGKKGEGCKFSHPKLCFSFKRSSSGLRYPDLVE